MRVLVAGRLSRKVTDRDQTGFDSQERDAVRWAEQNDHDVVSVVADYKTGRSGLDARPNLRPWVTEPAKLARYDAIVALKVDRLTRGNRAETAELEKWAADHGKTLFIVGSDVKFPSEGTDGIAWDLMLRMAHQEWLNTSERYQRMQRTRREDGSLVGRNPYGFRIVKQGDVKTLAHNDAEASVIRDAAEWYLSGRTLDSIAETLNESGRLPRAMKDGRQPVWAAKTLSQVLRNEAVIGRRRNGHGYTLKAEPILTRATWQAVITRMDKRATRKGVSPSKSQAMLTSIIKCGRCDRNMYRTNTGYYCRTRGCSSFVTVEYADSFVRDAMARNTRRDVTETVIPGSDHVNEIDSLKADMTDAIQRSDFGRLPALQAEIERLEAEPATPSRVVRRESDMTVAEMWAALPDDNARRAFLIERKATLTVEYREDDNGGKTRRLVFGGPWVRMAA